jgi:hypothetical protein
MHRLSNRGQISMKIFGPTGSILGGIQHLSTTVNVSPLLPYTTFTVFIFTKSTVNPAYGRRGRTLTVGDCQNLGETDE